MTIIYKNSGAWGAGSGRLTSLQADGNFYDLASRVGVLEAAGIAKEISSVAVVGNVMTFTYSDATTDQVTLPTVQFTYKGEWQPDTYYAAMDIVTGPDGTGELYAGNIYLVIYSHTSEGTTIGFDPGANDGLGHDYYALMMAMPSGILPVGGVAAEVLTKSSSTDYDVEWKAPVSVTQEVSTTTFTPALADANTYNRCTHASGCTVTIPEESSVDFPLDTELHFCQRSFNAIVFEWATAITVNYPSDCNASTNITGAVVTIKKIASDEWDLFGRLQTATV